MIAKRLPRRIAANIAKLPEPHWNSPSQKSESASVGPLGAVTFAVGIDELVAKLDQARAQNKRLEAEADHLAALIAAPVPTAEITSSQSQASGAEISN